MSCDEAMKLLHFQINKRISPLKAFISIVFYFAPSRHATTKSSRRPRSEQAAYDQSQDVSAVSAVYSTSRCWK